MPRHKKNKKEVLTAAEKQRKYREKRRQDVKREALYKEKHKLRNAKRKKAAEMNNREHRQVKRKWKTATRKFREKNALSMNLSFSTQSESTPVSAQPESRQKKQGRKCILKSRSKTVRENKKMQKRIQELEKSLIEKTKKIEKYRKRYEREIRNKTLITESPRSKTKKMMKNIGLKKVNMKQDVARKLVYHDVLVTSLKTAYTKLNNIRDKRMIGRIISSKLCQKYKMQRMAAHTIGLKFKKRFSAVKDRKSKEKYKKIEQFFLRDDVSHATAGKKETCTKNKLKMQKRFLVDSMRVLYKKFCNEKIIPEPVSYTLFTRCRPFYILKPTEDDRDTCRCVQHANLEFMACKLHHLKILPTANLHFLTAFLACDKNNLSCMFNVCKNCKDNKIPVSVQNLDSTTSWRKWSKVKEERYKMKDGVKSSYFVNVQKVITVNGTLKELIETFQSSMKSFKSHCYKIKHQNKMFRECKEQLVANEAAIIIDFSENYNCKLYEEIQSYHFGASRHQVTLHTGVLYMKDKNPISFSSISPSNEHGPPAIWAHLHLVLNLLRKNFPTIEVLHFFSDGPSTQYRQKKNFYLFTTQIFDFGFKAATWSFFEAGHGKGAADGIGATLKRSADQVIAHGTDIPDAETLFHVLKNQNLKVKLFFVPEENIADYFQQIPPNLVTVKGTHSIHQVVSTKPGEFLYRDVSCFCSKNQWTVGKFCKCFSSLEKFILEDKAKSQTGKQKISKEKRPSPIYSSCESETSTSSIDFSNNPGFSGYEPDKIQPGTYVLVKVFGNNIDRHYRYVGVCQEYDAEDGELKVAYFKEMGENGKLFRFMEEDVSYIDYDQVICILPNPQIVMKGNRVFYHFPNPVDVFEKA